MASRPSTADSIDRSNRLPTLIEVLSRQTLPPVDLYSFYIYMRDQQRSVDYLDFYLDISQHLSLCRHYVRELRRSVLLESPTPDVNEKTAARRTGTSGSKESSGYRGNGDSFDLGEASNPFGDSAARSVHSQKSLHSEEQHLSRVLRDQSRDSWKQQQSGHGDARRPRGSSLGLGRLNTGGQSSSQTSSNQGPSPQHTVTRADIRASAEKILYTFLLPGSEREIILPQGVVNMIAEAVENEGRDDPEVFDEAKEYVFQAMERDAFPGFLRAKALGNLVPPSLMLRLVVGLLAMFGGFWTSFILIFLDYSRALRCVVSLMGFITQMSLFLLTRY